MNARVDELTCRWMEDALSPGEATEFRELLSDPRNAASHFALCALESDLQSTAMLDLAEPTVARIRDEVGDSVRRNVVRILRDDREKTRPVSQWTGWAWKISLAAGFVVLLGGAWFLASVARRPDRYERVGTLAQYSGTVTVIRAGVQIAVQKGFEVRGEDRIQCGKSSEAIVAFAVEPTILRLSSEGDMRIGRDRDAWRIRLDGGILSCSIDKQEKGRGMVFVTPHASVTVVGTAFEMSVKPYSSRLAVARGAVRLTRSADRKEVLVSQGSRVEVGRGTEPITTEKTVVSRAIETNEGEQKWSLSRYGDPAAIGLSTNRCESGEHSFMVRYDYRAPGRGGRGYMIAEHPLAIGPDDEYLTCRVWTEQCDEKTEINIMTRMPDQGAWFLGATTLSLQPRDRWFTFRVPLRSPLKKNNETGSTKYDADRVVGFLFSVFGGNATVHVDDVCLESGTKPGETQGW